MRLLMVLGGFIGFALVLLTGLAQHAAWPVMVWKACLGACAAGLLLRWWGTVWAKCWQQVQPQQQHPAGSASEPSASEPPKV